MRRIIVRSRRPDAAPASNAVVKSFVTASEDRGARVIKSSSKRGQHVIYLTDADARFLAASRPDLVVEEDKPLELFRMPGLPPIFPNVADDVWEFKVQSAEGEPIPDCTIFAIGNHQGFKANTDEQGQAILQIHAGLIDRLIVSPSHGFWSRVLEPPTEKNAKVEATLTSLDPVAASAWVYRLLGIDMAQAGVSGRGVTVAVVDSGIAPVEGIEVAGGLNTLDDKDPADWSVDEKGHGTHCAGILAANGKTSNNSFRGIAPGVCLYSLKVFPGGFVSDLVEAIDWCREQMVDLVNLSLGSPTWSPSLALAIEEACEAGVVMVAAGGNHATRLAFPASHPDVIAVGAVGRTGSFPSDSAHSLKIGPFWDWWQGLFSANFTNFGPEVNICTPGVAIPSCVPKGYAAWDGTSMACPLVTGMLALLLDQFPTLRMSNRSQIDTLRYLLESAAVDMGMPRAIQGWGLPTMLRLQSAAENLLGR